MDKSENCTDCSKLVQVVNGQVGESATFRNVARLLHGGACEQHEAFFRQIQALCRRSFATFELSEPTAEEDTYVIVKRKTGDTVLFESSRGSSISGEAFIPTVCVGEVSEKGSVIAGRKVDRRWIDPELIRSWKRTCEAEHEDTCGPENQQQQVQYKRPRLPLLIDTERNCLTSSMEEDAAYVALSYIWGRVQITATTKANLSQLCEPGVFLKEQWVLPQTIRDAMGVTRLIGERYLWVDAVCLIQDDEEIRQTLIEKMGAVYARATVTIIAADGEDAHAGLLGLPELSDPRNNPCIVEGPGGIRLNWPSAGGLESSVWNQRAWTFQEYVFSRRRLIFVAGSVRWECSGGCCWEEHTENGSLPTTESTAAYDRDAGPIRKVAGNGPVIFPDLVKFDSLVNGFTTRECTYKDDVMDAFSGVLGMLAPRFSGGFLWGIPVMFLDLALLWKGSGDGDDEGEGRRWDPLELRHVKHRHAPTWSWASWFGGIETSMLWRNEDWLLRSRDEWFYNIDPIRRVIPLLDWRLLNDTNTGEVTQAIPHLNDWYKMKKQYSKPDLPPPPPGWTRNEIKLREDNSSLSLLSDDERTPIGKNDTSYTLRKNRDKYPPSYYYSQEDTGSAKFLCPLTTRQDCMTTEGFTKANNNRSRYLCATANRALLELRTGENANYEVLYEPLNMDQATKNDERCGRLWVDEPLDGDVSLRIELVAISMKYKAKGGERWEQPWGQEEAQLYNVLWIEWVDGVAYRKGVGEVDRGVWERQTREEIELVLG